MNEFITQFAIVVVAHLLAVMSPEPDFIVVSKNSFSYSRRIGVYTALGVALGIGVHVSYSLIGVGFLISKSDLLFNIIKIAGSFYLLYMAYKMIKSKPKDEMLDKAEISINPEAELSAFSAFKNGFWVNVLNPKATLFFLALFTQIISPLTPSGYKLIYGAEMMTMTFVWFSIVAYLFSHNILRTKINKFSHIIDRVTGTVLGLLALKVLTSSK